MFFFNLVKLVHRQTRMFNIIMHLRSFREFQNLSEETAENLIKLCFMPFLSNKGKKCCILVLNNFPVVRNYRNINFVLRCMDVLATNAQISMN